MSIPMPDDTAQLIIEWQSQALSNYRLSHNREISAPMRRQHTALAIAYTDCADALASLGDEVPGDPQTEDALFGPRGLPSSLDRTAV